MILLESARTSWKLSRIKDMNDDMYESLRNLATRDQLYTLWALLDDEIFWSQLKSAESDLVWDKFMTEVV